LCAALFYLDSFDNIKKFVNEVDCESNLVKDTKQIIESRSLQDSHLSHHEYRFLPEMITKFEKQGLKLSEQLDFLKEVKNKLSGYVLVILEQSLARNPDLNSFTLNIDLTFRLKTLYAPLTSVDVGRSFFQYKSILRENRQSFKEQGLESINVVHFNSFLTSD